MSKKIDKARDLLDSGDYSCVAVTGKGVYTSEKRGIAPIMEWLEADSASLRKASIADRVIGKAAAMLMLYGGVSEVYAGIISDSALEALAGAGIRPEYGRRVPYIINRAGDGMCPMEKACLEVNSPEEAYTLLSAKLAEMRKESENSKE